MTQDKENIDLESKRDIIRKNLILNMRNKGFCDKVISKRFNISEDEIERLFSDNKPNTKQPTDFKKEISHTIDLLKTRYPKAFSHPIKPLKIGIVDDISKDSEFMQNISKSKIRKALKYYTGSFMYLKSIINEQIRIDLNGDDSGDISEENKEYAKKMMKLKFKKKQNEPN